MNFTYTGQFDVRSARLPDNHIELDQVVAQLKGATIDRIEVVGHTDSTRIAPEHRNEFADNYALSAARAKTVGDYLAAQLGLKPEQVVSIGKGPDEPIGRQRHRRRPPRKTAV